MRAADRPPQPATVRSRVGGWPIAAALAVVAIILYLIRYALLPFVFAIAIAFVTDPLIRAGQRRLRLPRWVVGALVYVVLVLLLAATLYAIGANAAHDLTQIAERGPATLHKFIEDIVGPNGIAWFGKTYRADDVMQALSASSREARRGERLGAARSAWDQRAVRLVFLTLVLTPYFMISGPRLAAGAIWLIPPERRKSVTDLLPKIIPALRRYLLGIFLVVVYTSLIAWIGFGPVFALPGAVLLAVTVGILEIMPVVGPISAAILVGIVALQQETLQAAALLVGFVIALGFRSTTSSGRSCSGRRRGCTRSSSSPALSAARCCSASSASCSRCRWRYASRSRSNIITPSRSGPRSAERAAPAAPRRSS